MSDKLWEDACADIEVKNELLRLAKLGQQIQWVSVVERLPETNKNYIAATDNNHVIYAKYVKTIVRKKDVLRWEWYNRICPWNITHWMPLPTPPKDGADK